MIIIIIFILIIRIIIRIFDVRSTAADPLKASWIVSVFARACDRSGFGYLGPLESMISLI